MFQHELDLGNPEHLVSEVWTIYSYHMSSISSPYSCFSSNVPIRPQKPQTFLCLNVRERVSESSNKNSKNIIKKNFFRFLPPFNIVMKSMNILRLS